MKVKNGKEVTLTSGENFYEGLDNIHVVGRNASSTKTTTLSFASWVEDWRDTPKVQPIGCSPFPLAAPAATFLRVSRPGWMDGCIEVDSAVSMS